MIRLIFLSAIGLLVVALGILLTVRSTDPVQVHLSGDAADALRAEIILPDGLSYTDDINKARLRIVSVAEWFNLQFIPGAVAQCGTACELEDAPDLVRVISLKPAGSIKTVLLNATFLTNLRADDAPEPEALACLARIIEAELATLQSAVPPECAAQMNILTRRELPFGLGYF
ncbi:MAG: hypothetical protein AAGK28_03720 [Pseudomonadota bacterium]